MFLLAHTPEANKAVTSWQVRYGGVSVIVNVEASSRDQGPTQKMYTYLFDRDDPVCSPITRNPDSKRKSGNRPSDGWLLINPSVGEGS
jgi:hypothetical protein